MNLQIETYRPSILETHPLETWRMREMSHGRAPEWANSTIFWRVESGNGRPLTNTPPSWFTPLWPERIRHSMQKFMHDTSGNTTGLFLNQTKEFYSKFQFDFNEKNFKQKNF